MSIRTNYTTLTAAHQEAQEQMNALIRARYSTAARIIRCIEEKLQLRQRGIELPEELKWIRHSPVSWTIISTNERTLTILYTLRQGNGTTHSVLQISTKWLDLSTWDIAKEARRLFRKAIQDDRNEKIRKNNASLAAIAKRRRQLAAELEAEHAQLEREAVRLEKAAMKHTSKRR